MRALTHSSLVQSLVNKRKARDVGGLQANSLYRTSMSLRRYVPTPRKLYCAFRYLVQETIRLAMVTASHHPRIVMELELAAALG